MRSMWRVASVAGHLVLVAAAVVAVQAATSHVAYAPLRQAMVTLVVILAAVSLFGRFPFGVGPVAESVAARLVRVVGTVLAGVGAAGVVFGIALGGSPTERASSGVPILTGVLTLFLLAFLAATARGTALPPRAMLTSVGLGLLAAAVFAAAVPVLPPGLILLAMLLVAAAGAGAAGLARSSDALLAGLLATVTAGQSLFYAAAVLYQYGPDAWMPYAGPGPLTPEGQLDQNRAEAIDPYVGILLLAVLAAGFLIATVVTAKLRARAEAAPTAIPVNS